MLDELTFSGRELLLAILLATVIYVFEVLLFSRRRKKAASPRQESRESELDARLVTLEERLAVLESRLSADVAADPTIGVHAEAVRLAREGLSAEEVAERLGISQTEAELIIALKRAEG